MRDLGAVVLAIDPGRSKCGIAVCTSGTVLHREVARREDLPRRLGELIQRFPVEVIVVGDRTDSSEVARLAESLGCPVVRVPEHGTTLRARERYLRENPPRGWRRLVPRWLRVPEEPYDDYAAILLAEAYLRSLPGSPGDPEAR